MVQRSNHSLDARLLLNSLIQVGVKKNNILDVGSLGPIFEKGRGGWKKG